MGTDYSVRHAGRAFFMRRHHEAYIGPHICDMHNTTEHSYFENYPTSLHQPDRRRMIHSITAPWPEAGSGSPAASGSPLPASGCTVVPTTTLASTTDPDPSCGRVGSDTFGTDWTDVHTDLAQSDYSDVTAPSLGSADARIAASPACHLGGSPWARRRGGTRGRRT